MYYCIARHTVLTTEYIAAVFLVGWFKIQYRITRLEYEITPIHNSQYLMDLGKEPTQPPSFFPSYNFFHTLLLGK